MRASEHGADVLQKIVESPKTGLVTGSSTVAVSTTNFDWSSVATIAGLILTFVCLYVQIISVRNERKRAARESFEFRKNNPDAPEKLL